MLCSPAVELISLYDKVSGCDFIVKIIIINYDMFFSKVVYMFRSGLGVDGLHFLITDHVSLPYRLQRENSLNLPCL